MLPPYATMADACIWQKMMKCKIVTLPPEMSRIAARSLFGYSYLLSQRGCHVSTLAFQPESVSPVFSTSENCTCYTHTKFIISVISMCLKQATLSIRDIYDENFIWRFLKMTLFGVSELTLS